MSGNGLVLPFGHDQPTESQGAALSKLIQDCGTDGTPWFIVISPAGEVVFSDLSSCTDCYGAVTILYL